MDRSLLAAGINFRVECWLCDRDIIKLFKILN